MCLLQPSQVATMPFREAVRRQLTRTCVQAEPRAAAVCVQNIHLDKAAAAERKEQGLAVRQRHHTDRAVIQLQCGELVAQLTAFAPDRDHTARPGTIHCLQWAFDGVGEGVPASCGVRYGVHYDVIHLICTVMPSQEVTCTGS